MNVDTCERSLRVFTIAIATITAVGFTNVSAAQEKETIEQKQQALVVSQGPPVSAADQERYGLLTLDASCSASLLRNDWVITAAHCVDSPDTTMAGRPTGLFITNPENSVTLTANWMTPQVRQSVRIITFRPADIAIIRVAAPFSVAGSTRGYNRDVWRTGDARDVLGLPIIALGRGINVFAQGSGASATPSQSDGQFRLGHFKIQQSRGDAYTFSLWPAFITGGDSGGPSFTIVDGRVLLVGVHSWVTLKCLDGQICGRWPGPAPRPANYSNWQWVEGTGVAQDAWIAPIWDEIDRYLGAFTPTPLPPAPIAAVGRVRVGSNDFNADGSADILWHNGSTGESQVWFMSGSSRVGRATILDGGRPTRIGAPWGIVGSRDFNSDGKTDLLWHNSSTGEAQIWYMNGSTFSGRATVLGEIGGPARVGAPWRIVGTNDMNGDRKTDIVWHNGSTGETQIWNMDGHRVISRATVLDENGSALMVGLPWSIVGTGDFNSDRKPDIVWHNASTRATQVWNMDGHRVTGRATVLDENGSPINVGLPWRITGTNDFNRDGSADILWHNGSTGGTQIWIMKGHGITGRLTVDADRDGGGANVGAPWTIMSH